MAKTTTATGPSLSLEGNELVFRIPANKTPVLSKSQKNKLIASTSGNMRTELQIEGKPVVVGFNAYISA